MAGTFGFFLREKGNAGSFTSDGLSELRELTGYGFFGSDPVRYSQGLFLEVGSKHEVVAAVNGTVRAKPAPSPLFQSGKEELLGASREEWIDWFEYETLGAFVDSFKVINGELKYPADDVQVWWEKFNPSLKLFLKPIFTPAQQEFIKIAIGEIQYIVYRFLDPRSVMLSLSQLIEKNKGIKNAGLKMSDLDDSWSEEKKRTLQFYVFFHGNLELSVDTSDVLGEPALISAVLEEEELPISSADKRMLGVEIWLKDGPVDPVYFYGLLALNNLLRQDDETRWTQVRDENIVSQTGKIFKPDEDTNRFSQDRGGISISDPVFDEYTFPYPILKIIKNTSSADNNQWKELGRRQMKVYRSRLLDLAALRKIQLESRVGRKATADQLLKDEDEALAGTGLSPFRFNNSDWKNIFQLQAIVEFYMNYERPMDLDASPLDPIPDEKKVSLLDATTIGDFWRICKKKKKEQATSDIYLVQIDDFRLVGGYVPRLKEIGKRKNREWKASDYFRGMMFIVKGGEIIAKHQFTSYTSRENKTIQGRSSIKGNHKYGFRSAVAGKKGINYSFLVTLSPDEMRQDKKHPQWKLPGRTYFDYKSGVGVEDKTKSQIMLHQCIHYDGPYKKRPGQPWAYWSGSEGCQVSPFYYAFRTDLINAILADADWKTDLEQRIKPCWWKRRTEHLQQLPEESRDYLKVKASKPEDSLKELAKAGNRKESRRFHRLGIKYEEYAAEELKDKPVQVPYDPMYEWMDKVNEHIKSHPDHKLLFRWKWDGLFYGTYFLIRPDEKHKGWGA